MMTQFTTDGPMDGLSDLNKITLANQTDLSISKIEKDMEGDDNDIEDPIVMNEISFDNPLRQKREIIEKSSPDQKIKVKDVDENYLIKLK
jgi:hypothetical protein